MTELERFEVWKNYLNPMVNEIVIVDRLRLGRIIGLTGGEGRSDLTILYDFAVDSLWSREAIPVSTPFDRIRHLLPADVYAALDRNFSELNSPPVSKFHTYYHTYSDNE